MTKEEFMYEIFNKGKVCICNSPYETAEVLMFLQENGHQVDAPCRYHLDPESAQSKETDYPHVGRLYAQSSKTTCYSDGVITRNRAMLLSYSDFVSACTCLVSCRASDLSELF